MTAATKKLFENSKKVHPDFPFISELDWFPQLTRSQVILFQDFCVSILAE
jgi:hypothetical protein